jgi:hypothetical protein
VTTPEIWLSSDAAGHGWYVDVTPQWDDEFAVGPKSGDFGYGAGIDLLSTVTHELGHWLGYGDLDAALQGLDPMAGQLSAGQRRMPSGDLSVDDISSAGSLGASATWPVFGPALPDDLRSLEEAIKPLVAERDTLFADLGLADWPTVSSGTSQSSEASGRGRRKDRCLTRDEIFADWADDEVSDRDT